VFERGGSLAWKAFSSGELQTYTDISQAPEAHNPETPLEAEIIAPIGDWGVMASGSTSSTEFQNTDFDLVRVLTTAVENALSRMDRERKLREREQELSRQNKRLEEFTSVVSHDLRSPLNQATMSLDLITSDIEDDRLETAKRANERAIEMVDDLLALARQGKAVEETERQQVETTVQHAWQSTPTPEATLETDGSLGRVAADHSRLRQVFENLFRNAIEHGGDAVRVRVGALDDDGGLYIADDGPGVPEKMREDIFEHGYTTDGAGTGFGLAIVQRVIEAHGWAICVRESVDGGARFEISGMDMSPPDSDSGDD
jgi:signal transduction histidine kinase